MGNGGGNDSHRNSGISTNKPHGVYKRIVPILGPVVGVDDGSESRPPPVNQFHVDNQLKAFDFWRLLLKRPPRIFVDLTWMTKGARRSVWMTRRDETRVESQKYVDTLSVHPSSWSRKNQPQSTIELRSDPILLTVTTNLHGLTAAATTTACTSDRWIRRSDTICGVAADSVSIVR